MCVVWLTVCCVVCVSSVNWLDHSRTFREQGVEEVETLLLRRKFFYSDQNVDSRDPVQLNLLYVQVSHTHYYYILIHINEVSLIEIKISLTRETWPRWTAVHVQHETQNTQETKYTRDEIHKRQNTQETKYTRDEIHKLNSKCSCENT